MVGWCQLCSQLGLGKCRNGLQSDQWQENEQTSRESRCTGSSGWCQPHTWKIQTARAVLGREKRKLRAPNPIYSFTICSCSLAGPYQFPQQHFILVTSKQLHQGVRAEVPSGLALNPLQLHPFFPELRKGHEENSLHCLNPHEYSLGCLGSVSFSILEGTWNTYISCSCQKATSSSFMRSAPLYIPQNDGLHGSWRPPLWVLWPAQHSDGCEQG